MVKLTVVRAGLGPGLGLGLAMGVGVGVGDGSGLGDGVVFGEMLGVGVFVEVAAAALLQAGMRINRINKDAIIALILFFNEIDRNPVLSCGCGKRVLL